MYSTAYLKFISFNQKLYVFVPNLECDIYVYLYVYPLR